MTQKRSKNSSEAWTGNWAILGLAPAAIGAMLLVSLDARASDLTVTGNIDVSGDADIRGNELTLGTSGTNSAIPGITLTYTDAVISGTSESSLLTFTATRAFHGWLWQHENENQTATVPMMKMDPNHVLTIYDVSGNPAIVLNPANVSGPTSVLTEQAADVRYVSSLNFQVGTASQGTIAGPTIALTGGTATGPNSFAGINATASSYHTTASGYQSTASGPMSTASGSYSTAGGSYSTASGSRSTASGERSIASGYGATASGYSSTASGQSSKASGESSTASGYNSTASGVGSTSAGYFTIAEGFRQFVVGTYNIPQGSPDTPLSTDDLFIVGNGTGSVTPPYRSNAFVVKRNGDTRVYGNTLTLGSFGTNNATSALSMIYDDGTGGVNSAISLQATRPSAAWNWQRLVTSGTTTTPVTAMQLDASNRLVLTGTAAVNPPQIVLDPNGVDGPANVLTQASADERYVVNGGTSATTLSNTVITGALSITGTATVNGSTLLTQTAGDTRYIPAASGMTLLNGKVGIGTTTPTQLLHIKGASARMRIEGSGWDNPVLEMAGPNYTNYLFVNQTDGGWYLRTDSLSRHVFIQCAGPNSGGANQGMVQIGGIPTPPSPPGSQLVVRGNTNSSTFGLLDAQNYSGTSVFLVRSDGRVGIGTTAPQAALDVNGGGRITGDLAISGSGSLTLPDGTILSASNTLRGVIASGTASTISGTIPVTQVSGLSAVATTGAYSSLTGLPTIPVDTNQLANGAGYITASGTVAFAQASGTAAVLSGTIQASQVAGLSGVAVSGDYASLTGLPTIPTDTNQLVNGAGYVTASGTTNGITLSGTTKVAEGGFIVTGTAVQVTSGTTTITKIVSSGSNHLVLIPEQGDLSMGTFTAGPVPQ